jgi:hypothetical protein
MKQVKVPIIKGVPGVEGKKVTITKTKEPGLVKLQAGLSLVQKRRIKNIEWEFKQERSGGKAAVGAIGGGLVAGPMGLIAGAALGGRKKEASTAVINLEEGGQLWVKATAKEYEAIYKML